MPKWEYLSVGWFEMAGGNTKDPAIFAQAINKLGAEGWELVAINDHEQLLIFKRPLNA